MFSSNRGPTAPADSSKAPPAQPEKSRPKSSVIAQGAIIQGGLKTPGDIQIDGRVEGDVRAASIALGSEGELIGDLYAENARLNGRVNGNIYAGHVALASNAHVFGNLLCKTFEVETGARLEGNCWHADNPLAPRVGRPELNGATRAPTAAVLQPLGAKTTIPLPRDKIALK
jgi:cytoskeletal protein CcmA (bactofilin family)